MATFTLLLLTLVCNIIELSSLYAPSCSREHDCNTENDHQQHQHVHYVAAKDDPDYQLQDEEQLSEFDFSDLHHRLNCYQHATNQKKPMYTPEMYRHMKDQFTKLTGMEFEPLPAVAQTVYHIGESEGAGRGVFASRGIKKGEIIPFDDSVHVVTFTDGMLWKEYIMSLPRTMGCDVLEWTWSQNVHKMGDVRLCLSIGDGDSYLNNADLDEDINIAPTNMTSMKFWAVRDIEKGEELIYDYEVFEPTEYEQFGLGVNL